MAGLRPQVRACYNQGLQSDPEMSGTVLVSIKITPKGEVFSAEAAENTGLPPRVVQCILGKVRGAVFDPPGANGSVLRFPVTLVQQGK